MKIFITSDTHFNHKSMIKEKWRNFDTVKAMNEHIIYQWNRTVGKDDFVIHLGDVFIGKKEEGMKNIIPKLNGKIFLIKGNHDKGLQEINVKASVICYKGLDIELVHNPQDASGKYKYVIHGHLHQHNMKFTKKPKLKYYNVNIELHKYRPKLLNEIIGEMK